MAGAIVRVSTDDSNAFPSQSAFISVQSAFDHDPEAAYACEEALAALMGFVDFPVPETRSFWVDRGVLPEDYGSGSGGVTDQRRYHWSLIPRHCGFYMMNTLSARVQVNSI